MILLQSSKSPNKCAITSQFCENGVNLANSTRWHFVAIESLMAESISRSTHCNKGRTEQSCDSVTVCIVRFRYSEPSGAKISGSAYLYFTLKRLAKIPCILLAVIFHNVDASLGIFTHAMQSREVDVVRIACIDIYRRHLVDEA